MSYPLSETAQAKQKVVHKSQKMHFVNGAEPLVVEVECGWWFVGFLVVSK
jgi:hypothetical protein